MPETHARLSASAAHRWLNCPPSAALTADMPESSSSYAEEGTLAHSLAELKVLKKFTVMKKSEYDKRFKEISAHPLYCPEMDGHTDTYLEYILGIAHSYSKVKPYVVAEKKLDYSHIAPEGFGTGDCVMICRNDLHIFDFKYGKGVPVSAEDNPQLRLYALGALNEYSFLYDIQNVHMHIIQPRIENGISSSDMPVSDLTAWGEAIKPVAEDAYNGRGEYKCGDWCRFCKAKAICRKRAEYLLDVEETAKMPPELLSHSEIGDVLRRVRMLKNYIEDIESYALNEILSGNSVDGWKAVEGTSRRKITDVDAAFKILTDNGVAEAMLYEKTPIGITALDKLLSKDQLALIGSYIQKPKGKPTLVPASDKREDYKSVDVNKIFGGNDND